MFYGGKEKKDKKGRRQLSQGRLLGWCSTAVSLSLFFFPPLSSAAANELNQRVLPFSCCTFFLAVKHTVVEEERGEKKPIQKRKQENTNNNKRGEPDAAGCVCVCEGGGKIEGIERYKAWCGFQRL